VPLVAWSTTKTRFTSVAAADVTGGAQDDVPACPAPNAFKVIAAFASIGKSITITTMRMI
jgi:hypothetical protein